MLNCRKTGNKYRKAISCFSQSKQEAAFVVMETGIKNVLRKFYLRSKMFFKQDDI